MATTKPDLTPLAALTAELVPLRRRLEALEDERLVRDLLHRYSPAIDYGPPVDWAALFTEDGVFEVYTVKGEPVRKKVGRAQIAAYLATKKLPPVAYDKHLVASPNIRIKGDTAHVESYVITFKDVPGRGRTIGGWGRYHDTLVKQDGRWLFKERKAEMAAREPTLRSNA